MAPPERRHTPDEPARNGGRDLTSHPARRPTETLRAANSTTFRYRYTSRHLRKRARVAPVAQLYERARVHHAGPARRYAELEEQMMTFVGQGEAEDSPDLLDSLVRALWDLFLDPTMPVPCPAYDRRLNSRR
ncbi:MULTISPECIES: hypothetical protein [unclassified Streptomyces]|uniref:phage terminase large subunit family protein n=1 Tax=unclassified Streptomyces TaxID=2593676 RepID=UPI0037F6A9E0